MAIIMIAIAIIMIAIAIIMIAIHAQIPKATEVCVHVHNINAK